MILIVCPTPSLQRRMRFRRMIPGGVNRAVEAEILPSGKGVNAARAVMACGGNSQVLQFLGGETGRVMRQMLQKAGISSRNIGVHASTRMCVTLQESKSGTVTELVENSGGVRVGEVRALMAAFRKSLVRAEVGVGMGSLPPGVSTTFYRDLVRVARKVGKPFIVDAQGEALMRCLSARPLLVKPNRDELAVATGVDCGTRMGLKYAVRKLHQRGAQWVLVTDGEKPAFLSDGVRSEDFRMGKIRVRNPVGSGDSLAGGVALALERGHGLRDAVRFGLACGMANAAGGGYGILDRAVLKACSRP